MSCYVLVSCGQRIGGLASRSMSLRVLYGRPKSYKNHESLHVAIIVSITPSRSTWVMACVHHRDMKSLERRVVSRHASLRRNAAVAGRAAGKEPHSCGPWSVSLWLHRHMRAWYGHTHLVVLPCPKFRLSDNSEHTCWCVRPGLNTAVRVELMARQVHL